MKLQGENVVVNKSAEELFQFLSIPANYEQIMPEDMSKFEARDTGFLFALKGMPEIALKIKELIPNSQIILAAAGKTLDFDLSANITPVDEKSSAMKFDFNGNFNPMIKMMVEKPLTKLIATLTTNLGKL